MMGLDPTSVTRYHNTTGPVIWFFGCSNTAGVGVAQSESWPSLVEKALKLPAIMAAKPGTSISWSADQILRADIKPGDYVFWGLTQVHRDYIYDENDVVHHIRITRSSRFSTTDKHLVSNDLVCKTIDRVLQAKNFLSKINCTHRFLLVAPSLECSGKKFLGAMSEVPEFLNGLLSSGTVPDDFDLNNKTTRTKKTYADLGTDHMHPGPQQHQLFAKIILESLECQSK